MLRNSDHNTSPAHTTKLHVVCALALNSHAAQAASVEAEEGAAELRYRQHTHTHMCCSRRPPRPSLTPTKQSSQPRLWSSSSSNSTAHTIDTHAPSKATPYTSALDGRIMPGEGWPTGPRSGWTHVTQRQHLHAMHCTYTRGGGGKECPHLSLHLPAIFQAQVAQTSRSLKCMAFCALAYTLRGQCE